MTSGFGFQQSPNNNQPFGGKQGANFQHNNNKGNKGGNKNYKKQNGPQSFNANHAILFGLDPQLTPMILLRKGKKKLEFIGSLKPQTNAPTSESEIFNKVCTDFGNECHDDKNKPPLLYLGSTPDTKRQTTNFICTLPQSYSTWRPTPKNQCKWVDFSQFSCSIGASMYDIQGHVWLKVSDLIAEAQFCDYGAACNRANTGACHRDHTNTCKLDQTITELVFSKNGSLGLDQIGSGVMNLLAQRYTAALRCSVTSRNDVILKVFDDQNFILSLCVQPDVQPLNYKVSFKLENVSPTRNMNFEMQTDQKGWQTDLPQSCPGVINSGQSTIATFQFSSTKANFRFDETPLIQITYSFKSNTKFVFNFNLPISPFKSYNSSCQQIVGGWTSQNLISMGGIPGRFSKQYTLPNIDVNSLKTVLSELGQFVVLPTMPKMCGYTWVGNDPNTLCVLVIDEQNNIITNTGESSLSELLLGTVCGLIDPQVGLALFKINC